MDQLMGTGHVDLGDATGILRVVCGEPIKNLVGLSKIPVGQSTQPGEVVYDPCRLAEGEWISARVWQACAFV
jgi:hypothetical protein